jgi:hypothetical protein
MVVGVLHMSPIDRRIFLAGAAASLTLASVGMAEVETVYDALSTPKFFGVPADHLLPKFEWLPGATRNGNVIILTEKAKSTIENNTDSKGRWWNKHNSPDAFRAQLAKQIHGYEKYLISDWVGYGASTVTSFNALVKWAVESGKCPELAILELPILVTGAATALAFGVYLDKFAVKFAELIAGVDYGKGVLASMQAAQNNGFISHYLKKSGSFIYEGVEFQPYKDAPGLPLWGCGYTERL